MKWWIAATVGIGIAGMMASKFLWGTDLFVTAAGALTFVAGMAIEEINEILWRKLKK